MPFTRYLARELTVGKPATRWTPVAAATMETAVKIFAQTRDTAAGTLQATQPAKRTVAIKRDTESADADGHVFTVHKYLNPYYTAHRHPRPQPGTGQGKKATNGKE